MITASAEDGILTLTLNRPDQLNALNDGLLNALEQQLLQAKNNDNIFAIILIGAGKAFCAGADINELATLNSVTGYEFAKRGQAIFRQLETLGKPSIAAINGHAFGGGCELAMAASVRLASQHAQFGQPEAKLGVIPGFGGTQRLARLVGKGRAMDLCLTGRFINANEALSWGLVSQVCAADELLTTAKQFAQQIMANGPMAVESILRVIDQGYEIDLPSALELEASQFAVTCGSKQKTEGVEAFLTKREAKFR